MSSLTPLIDFLREIGAPYERFLEAANIPTNYIDQPDHLVPLLSAYRFFEIAAQKEGEQYLGLIIADYVRLDNLGGYGNKLLQSKTVYDYLMTGIQLLNTQTTGEQFSLQEVGGSIHFSHTTFRYLPEQQRLTTLFALGAAINTLRQVLGPDWVPDEIGLPVLPSQRLSWNNLAGTEIKKTNNYSYFSFPQKLLFNPFQLAANQSAILETEPEKLETGLVESTSQLIRMMLPYGYPDINQVVDCAGFSKRTLQRVLQGQGLNYKTLVEEARMDIACESLQHSDNQVTTIAQQLAYNDSSNFTRAFRRKMGFSPSAYRANFK
jgi:AraC-like DNA-binding protein